MRSFGRSVAFNPFLPSFFRSSRRTALPLVLAVAHWLALGSSPCATGAAGPNRAAARAGDGFVVRSLPSCKWSGFSGPRINLTVHCEWQIIARSGYQVHFTGTTVDGVTRTRMRGGNEMQRTVGTRAGNSLSPHTCSTFLSLSLLSPELEVIGHTESPE